MIKLQPDKAKSPNRPSLIPTLQHQPSELESAVIEKLAASIELKRNEIKKVYSGINNQLTDDNDGDDNQRDKEILKHVRFESIDITNSPPSKLTATYTVHQAKGRENKATTNSVFKQTRAPSKVPPQSAVIKPKIENKSSLKSPLRQATNIRVHSTRPNLTYQQKKKLEHEQKVRFEQRLQAVREKIIVRKLAYIWLRKFIYSRKAASWWFLTGRKMMPLPSQAE